MIGANIIADNTPQVANIIQRAVEEIRQISSQVKVEYIDYDKCLVPTQETIVMLNDPSRTRYKSHKDLVDEIQKEIEAERQ